LLTWHIISFVGNFRQKEANAVEKWHWYVNHNTYTKSSCTERSMLLLYIPAEGYIVKFWHSAFKFACLFLYKNNVKIYPLNSYLTTKLTQFLTKLQSCLHWFRPLCRHFLLSHHFTAGIMAQTTAPHWYALLQWYKWMCTHTINEKLYSTMLKIQNGRINIVIAVWKNCTKGIWYNSCLYWSLGIIRFNKHMNCFASWTVLYR